jgi:hypothetical protein
MCTVVCNALPAAAPIKYEEQKERNASRLLHAMDVGMANPIGHVAEPLFPQGNPECIFIVDFIPRAIPRL